MTIEHLESSKSQSATYLHWVEQKMSWRGLHLVHPVEVKVVTLPVEARHFLHPLGTKQVDEEIFSRAMFNEEVLDNNQVVTWVHSRVPGNLNASSQVFKCSAHKPIRNICTWELRTESHRTISTKIKHFGQIQRKSKCYLPIRIITAELRLPAADLETEAGEQVRSK